MSTQPFDSRVNFLDPKYNQKGEPYGPYRYKQLVKECYFISKNCNTSYQDVLRMTPLEGDYIIGFLIEEGKETAKLISEIKNKNSSD